MPWLFGIMGSVIFLMTMCRTVPGGDSGELISVAYNLGVAHPPGYPLYTLLAHVATYLPVGSIAWRVNVLSGVFALASGLMLYSLVARWLKDRWLGVLAAGIFIFSPLAWRYAVMAEVFSLNNLFVVALLYISLRFCEEPSGKWAFVWSGVLGLACSHHHTIIFLALPLFAVLLWRHSKLLLEPKVFLLCIGVFALGFLPYLYIPWAGQKNLMISWGHTGTWDGFWTHFLRREYGTFQLATGSRDFMNTFSNLKYYSQDMWLQFLWVGVPLALYGVWYYWRQEKQNAYARLLLFAWLFYVLVFHALANMDLSNRLFYDVQSRFWLLPNIILAIFMVAGLKLLLRRAPAYEKKMKVVLVMLALGLQIGIHYEREDHSRNTVFYDLGKSFLDGLPPNALAFMRGDVYVNSVRYMQSVEKYRPDVMSIPFDLLWWPWARGMIETNFPNIKWPGRVYRYKRSNLGEFTLRDFFELNAARQPTYIGKLADYEVANLTEKFRLLPVGFLNRIVPLEAPLDFKQYFADVEGFAGFKPPGKDEIREKSWEAFIYYNYWDREMEKAKFLFEVGTKGSENFDVIAYGASILARLVREYPEAPANAYRNLGVAYQLMSRRDGRYYQPMILAWREYLARNPQDDNQIESIKAAVQGAATLGILSQSPGK
ncbi:MAG: DUF2723 domain-containing protein [Bdellovibrionales bacterium]